MPLRGRSVVLADRGIVVSVSGKPDCDLRKHLRDLLEDRDGLSVFLFLYEIRRLTNHNCDLFVVGCGGDDRVVVRLTRVRGGVLARIEVRLKDESLNVTRIDGQRPCDRLQRQRNVILLRIRGRDLEDRRRIFRVKRERRFELRARVVEMLFGGIDASERH